ncbi:MAG: hypothetical protein GY913_29140 [Proteobacteria bacterium]|nr:hypothetical protein [Pseudomonadota bacterium]MCP4920980.1 hypothetical protein [Pseudomonadota bacterium]
MFLFALACTGAEPDPAETDGPLYYEDVAPILADNCVSCHQEGQIAPFYLVDYDSVSVVGSQIADSVTDRRMPPFLADNSGECNTYEHAAWLEDDEIATIVDWVDAGMPEGDPANAPELPAAPTGLEERATHSLVMDTPYIADFEGADDDYRCFIIDPGLTEDGYVTAFEIDPGDPEIVHHVIVYHPSDEAALASAYELEEDAGGNGYTCFGGPNVDSSMVAAWAPGRMIWDYPEGTGIKVEAGMPLIVQMHYNNGGTSNEDATTVNFEIQPEVDEELISFFWVNSDIAIPPGEELHEESQKTSFKNYTGYSGDLDILGVGPHMHSIGHSEYAEVQFKDTDETACLVDVPRWDFNWQFAYMFEERIRVSGGDKLLLECNYDSSDRTDTTYWGDGTGDEMCLLTLYVTVPQ